MSDKITSLLETIEQLRQEMIEAYLGSSACLLDPELLAKSQQLDIQLNNLSTLTNKF